MNCQLKLAFVSYVIFAILHILDTAMIPGGITHIEKHDLLSHPELFKGLDQAIRLENAKEPKPPFKFVYLPYTLDASSQVVQGTMYRASVTLAPSKCRNDLNETREGIEACGVEFLSPDVLRQEKCCTFEIWSRPWLPGPERVLVQKAECKSLSCSYRIRWTMKFKLNPLCNLLVTPTAKP